MAKPKTKPAFESKVPPRPSASRTRPARPGPARRPSTRTEAVRRQRNRRLLTFGASTLVVIVVVVLVVVKVTSGSSSGSNTRPPLSAAALNQLASVPVSTLVEAAKTASASSVSPPSQLPANATPLTSGGKPEILFMGAEYCPYCAAERWAMVMAWSKFGTFSNLSTTRSSSTDTNPNTPTLSFYGSSYTSPYLVFTPVELEDRTGKTLQTPTATQNQLITTYDTSPYTTGQPGSIPFIYLAGKFLVSGVQYNGAAISNMSFDNALAYMTSGTNSTSRAAMAVAAHLIGVTCSLTNNRPASVCSAVPASLKTGQPISGNQGSSTAG